MSLNQYPVPQLSVAQKLWSIHWTFLLIVTAIMAVGISVLYSVSGGAFDPWGERQLVRYCFGLVVLFCVAMTDIRYWLKGAYLIYAVALILILAVPWFGTEGGGARRWLAIAGFTLQPSELMKFTLVLALARFYNNLPPQKISKPWSLLIPMALMAIPAFVVMRQPDLGTAVLFIVIGGAVIYLAGVSIWYFVGGAIGGLVLAPFVWDHLYDYQRQRILTFLDPDRDPLGAGYHVLQSKIALGAGGLTGTGYMKGTQSQLNFLPEKHTDFIFTMFAEEMGFVGGTGLIVLYGLMLVLMTYMAIKCRSKFSRLLSAGITFTVFIYVFINIAMAMGLVPVVGVPLPLMSYGGTSMITLMFALGLVMSAYIHREWSLRPLHQNSSRVTDWLDRIRGR